MCFSLQLGSSPIAFATIAMLSLGCGSKPSAQPAAANTAVAAPAAIDHPDATNADAPKEIPDEECIAFAKKLEDAVIADDGHSAGDLFTWGEMVDRALQGLSSPEHPNQIVENMRAGGAQRNMQLPNTLGAQIKEGGSYKFLRIRSGSDGKRVVFRLLGANGGLNYHEMTLGRRENKVVATDMYIFFSGETMPQSVRQMALVDSVVSDIKMRSPEVQQELKKYDIYSFLMAGAYQEGRFEDCIAMYGKMRPSLQKEKSLLLQRLLAARNVGEQAEAAAIEAFRAVYPDEVCVDLIALDSLFRRKAYREAREAIDRIDKAVGGDPYLHVLRANTYLMEDKFEDADNEAKAAIAEDSTRTDAWWVRVSVALKMQKFARAVDLLNALKEDHGQEPADLTDPLFAEFMKSPEYKTWLKEKPSNP